MIIKYTFILEGEVVEIGSGISLDFIKEQAEDFCKKYPYKKRSFSISESSALKEISNIFHRYEIEDFCDFAAF